MRVHGSKVSAAAVAAIVAVVGMVLVIGMVAVPAVASSTQPGTDPAGVCTGLEGLSKAPALSSDISPDGDAVTESPLADGTSIPVVVVHGWTGRSTHDDARTGAFSGLIDLTANNGKDVSIPRSLIGSLQDLGGVSVYTFDYYDTSARWVTDDTIAPRLADALVCLAQAHGRPAVVVAHSMGGLAARAALDQIAVAPGAQLTDVVSDVVTFGTPNTGSWLASVVGGADVGAQLISYFPGAVPKVLAALRSVLVLCGTATSLSLEHAGACGLLPEQISSARSDAGRALAIGSKPIDVLAPWPDGIRVHALAGSIDLEIVRLNWFRASTSVGGVNTGDFVVGADSAVEGSTTSRELECFYTLDVGSATGDNVLEALELRSANETRDNVYTSLAESACFHGNLMRSIELANEALGIVVDLVDSAAAEPAIPAQLRGTWCTRSQPQTCFSFDELFAQFPQAWFLETWESADKPGATNYSLCLERDLGDTCTTAMSAFFQYLPEGVGWDCPTYAESAGWPGCEVDFTAAHEPAEPRLLRLPNHQQGDGFIDSEPMYRTELAAAPDDVDYHYRVFDSATTWPEAQQHCLDQGGYLAVLDSAAEDAYAYSWLRDQGVESAYFGLRMDAAGTWGWEQESDTDYLNWARGEPNGERGVERYAMYYWQFQDGTWNDGDFGEGTRGDPGVYLCEFDTIEAATAAR